MYACYLVMSHEQKSPQTLKSACLNTINKARQLTLNTHTFFIRLIAACIVHLIRCRVSPDAMQTSVIETIFFILKFIVLQNILH